MTSLAPRRIGPGGFCLALMASLAMLTGGGHAQIASITRVPGTPAAWEPGSVREVGPIHIVPIRGGMYMLASEAGNSTVQIGEDGLVVVDTLSAEMAPRLVDAIRAISPKPVIQIISTNADRVGGNEIVRKAGLAAGAPIFAHEEVLNRVSVEGSSTPRAAWPTNTYFVGTKDLFLNGEPVRVIHQPAVTDGDSLVMFRRSDVVVVSDLFLPDQYPRVDLERGGSLNAVVAGLNRVLDLTVPEVKQDGGTMVVPGIGRLGDEADVADYRDMVTIVRDRIEDMIRRKMTLEQVKAARPTRDYDTVYATPAYSADAFVEVAYRSLSAK